MNGHLLPSKLDEDCVAVLITHKNEIACIQPRFQEEARLLSSHILYFESILLYFIVDSSLVLFRWTRQKVKKSNVKCK